MHPKTGTRRRHSDELKAEVLAACDAPGASISGVALAHGLNTNLVRKWRSGRGAKIAGTSITPAAASKAAPAPPPALRAAPAPEFVAIEMPGPPKAAARATGEPSAPTPSPSAESPIEVELRRGTLHLNVRWPTAAAGDCRAWLRELTSGLVK